MYSDNVDAQQKLIYCILLFHLILSYIYIYILYTNIFTNFTNIIYNTLSAIINWKKYTLYTLLYTCIK